MAGTSTVALSMVLMPAIPGTMVLMEERNHERRSSVLAALSAAHPSRKNVRTVAS